MVLHYIGPGKRDTGDWCFTDGFITFQDIMERYLQHFHGKTCTLHCDCSYSGHWVRACEEYLENIGVQSCGHSARNNGIQVKICASCQPDQVPSSLMYSSRGCENDNNTAALILWPHKEISPDQTICGIDFTSITCDKSWDEECALSPDFTFHRRREVKRIFIVNVTNRGRKAWHYILLDNDPETTRIFKEKTQGEQGGTEDANLGDYGEILKSGSGEEPPQEVKDWITRVHKGIEILPYQT